MERPAGLSPALIDKAEEVQRKGGAAKVQQLLEEVGRLRQANSALLEQVRSLLYVSSLNL